VHAAAVGAGVGLEVAVGVVDVVVGGAVGVDVARDVLVAVAKEPFLQLVGMDDPVGVAQDVVVVPGLLPESVGDVGQPDVLVPLQRGGEGAVVGPFAHGLGLRGRPVVLKVDAATGAVGVAGHEVMAVAIVPARAVLVLRRDQVAVFIMRVGRKLADDLPLLDLPQAFDQPALRVRTGSNMGEDHIVLFAHDVAEHLLAAGNDVVVAQTDGGTGAGLLGDQAEVLFALDADLAGNGVNELVDLAPIAGLACRHGLAKVKDQQRLAHAREGDFLDGIAVAAPDREHGVGMAAAIGAMEDETALAASLALGGGGDVDPRIEGTEPPRAKIALVISSQVAVVGAMPSNGQSSRKLEVRVGEAFAASGEADGVRSLAARSSGGIRGSRPSLFAAIAGVGSARLETDVAQFAAGIVLAGLGPFVGRHVDRDLALALEQSLLEDHDHPRDPVLKTGIGEPHDLISRQRLEVDKAGDHIMDLRLDEVGHTIFGCGRDREVGRVCDDTGTPLQHTRHGALRFRVVGMLLGSCF
jgi:hypothetical protein